MCDCCGDGDDGARRHRESELQAPLLNGNSTAAPTAQRVDRGLARAHAGVSKMQALLDGYGTALSFVRGGTRLLGLVPGLKGVCDEIRGLLDDAEGGGELAQDVLDFIELVLEAADHLLAVARAAEKAGGDVQRELEKPMNALRKVLANGRKAVAEFSARGVLSALFAAAKTARSLRRLGTKLRDRLAAIDRKVQLQAFSVSLDGRFKAEALAPAW